MGVGLLWVRWRRGHCGVIVWWRVSKGCNARWRVGMAVGEMRLRREPTADADRPVPALRDSDTSGAPLFDPGGRGERAGGGAGGVVVGLEVRVEGQYYAVRPGRARSGAGRGRRARWGMRRRTGGCKGRQGCGLGLLRQRGNGPEYSDVVLMAGEM